MLPAQFVAVREIGDVSQPYWTAASANGQSLVLEAGESVLWTARALVRELRPRQWSMPDATTLIATDRRFVYLTTHFDTGGGWVGIGAVGLAVSVTANAVSKHRAAKRSAGRVAIGQIRYEWLEALWVRHQKSLIGAVDTYVDLSVRGAHGSHVIELWGQAARGELASWLARVVAGHRLAVATGLGEADLATLRRYESGGSDASPSPIAAPGWVFPGADDAAITAAMAGLRAAPRAQEAQATGGTAGWYRDPLSDVAWRRRWWDGTAWTTRTDPDAGEPGTEALVDAATPENLARQAPPVLAVPAVTAPAETSAVQRSQPAEAGGGTAGWYRDPLSDVAWRRRWWDGTAWTTRTDPDAGEPGTEALVDAATPESLAQQAPPVLPAPRVGTAFGAPFGTPGGARVVLQPSNDHAAVSNAGWYRDPLADVAWRRRWWDGAAWTTRTDPEAGEPGTEALVDAATPETLAEQPPPSSTRATH